MDTVTLVSKDKCQQRVLTLQIPWPTLLLAPTGPVACPRNWSPAPLPVHVTGAPPPTPVISFLVLSGAATVSPAPRHTSCLLIPHGGALESRCLSRMTRTRHSRASPKGPPWCLDSRPSQASISPSLFTSHPLALFVKGLHLP